MYYVMYYSRTSKPGSVSPWGEKKKKMKLTNFMIKWGEKKLAKHLFVEHCPEEKKKKDLKRRPTRWYFVFQFYWNALCILLFH